MHVDLFCICREYLIAGEEKQNVEDNMGTLGSYAVQRPQLQLVLTSDLYSSRSPSPATYSLS